MVDRVVYHHRGTDSARPIAIVAAALAQYFWMLLDARTLGDLGWGSSELLVVASVALSLAAAAWENRVTRPTCQLPRAQVR
jgi:hypothetical protein